MLHHFTYKTNLSHSNIKYAYLSGKYPINISAKFHEKAEVRNLTICLTCEKLKTKAMINNNRHLRNIIAQTSGFVPTSASWMIIHFQ